jgi:hypothetical protein
MSPITLTMLWLPCNRSNRCRTDDRHRIVIVESIDVVRVYRPDCPSNKTIPRMSYKYDRTRTGVFDVAIEPLYSKKEVHPCCDVPSSAVSCPAVSEIYRPFVIDLDLHRQLDLEAN